MTPPLSLPPLAFFLSLGLVLTACPGKSDDDDSANDTGTDNTDGDYTEEEVLFAAMGVELPGSLVFIMSMIGSFNEEGDCPSVTTSDDGDTVTVQGGCTDDQGTTYEGTVVVASSNEGSQAVITYEGFSFSDTDGSLGMDGDMVVDAANKMTTNGTLSFDTNGDGNALVYTYTDHALDTISSYFDTLFGDPGDYTLSGQTELAGVDTFTIDGTVSHQGTCDLERDSLVLNLSGTRGDITILESEDTCDGCKDWSTAESSGTICDEGNDTGEGS